MNKIKAVTPKITASKVDGDIYYSIHYYDAERKAWVVGFTSSDYDTVAAWKDTALEDISDSVVGIRPIPKSASDDIRQSNKLVFLQAIGSCFAPAEERDPEALGTLTLPEDGNMTEGLGFTTGNPLLSLQIKLLNAVEEWNSRAGND